MMDKNELLYDHYKDTVVLQLEAKKKRDTAFIMLCIAITLLFCFLIDSASIYNSLLEMMKAHFSLSLPFTSSIIQSFLWVMVLYFFIRYYQNSTYVERQYDYINDLEKTIEINNSIKFDRESKSYNDNYPLVLELIHIFYFWIFPILLTIIIGLKIYFEFTNITNILAFIFDCIIAVMIIILSIFYLIFLHRK